jgi:hypothetical protein
MSRLVLPLLLSVGVAFAGRRRPPPDDQLPAAVPVPEVAEVFSGPLFPPTVVTTLGPVPAGLAHVGAQACAACHPRSFEGWRHGAHAQAPSETFVAATVGLAGCDACHRPLQPQRPTLDVVWGGRMDQVASAPNPSFDAGAWLEGVTCAACHVRDGFVLTADAESAERPSPHPMRFAPALADGSTCATCHQLAVPGAPGALYDTWGEFERSGFAEAGVTCISCHGRAGAEPGFVSHDVARPLEHGLTVGLSVPALRVVRGAPPVQGLVRLQNTGAGHAIPTGSPWRRLEVRVFLEGPPDKAGTRPRRGEVLLVLGRELAVAPPFEVSADTRLQAGESREIPFALALPADVPASGWELVVNADDGAPEPRSRSLQRRWPLTVE